MSGSIAHNSPIGVILPTKKVLIKRINVSCNFIK